MKRVVIDTNVLVSSTLSSEGNSAKIMNLISDKEVQLYYSPEILAEYRKVLAVDTFILSPANFLAMFIGDKIK